MEQSWWPRTRGGDLVPYLNEDEHRRLLAAMETVAATPGQVILKKGSPSQSLLLVDEGEIGIFDDAVGSTIALNRVGPGGVVGEVGFVDGQARTHEVRAIVACRLRRLTRDRLLSLVQGDPELFAKLLIALAQVLARRYRMAMAELEPVRAFAASLREPLVPPEVAGEPAVPFEEIDEPLPGPGRPGAAGADSGGDTQALALEALKEVARRALEGRGPTSV